MKKAPIIYILLAVLMIPLAIRAEKQPVVVAYITSWSETMPNPAYMTHINYAFGHVNDTFDGVRIDNPEKLREIAQLKKKRPGLHVQLSVGGWGSGRFSEMAADATNRKKFAADCRRIVDEYGLDGIDIDWEYPTVDAAGISASADDTRNFTLLMHDLRKALPSPKLLTLASVHNAQYIDFKGVMPYVDFVNVMSYDMARAPQHHSPLHASEKCGTNSAEAAVEAHLRAGVPASKMTMGLPFYGRGTGPYADFVDYGKIRIADGCHQAWDTIASAPYIADANGKLVLGYDDARSMEAKCRYIIDKGLLGGMYWEYAGDTDTDQLRRTVASTLMPTAYPANYASAPRFNALVYYADKAEEAHVQFADQAINFIHKLSYGEGFTYTVTTSLAQYRDSLDRFDLIIAINAMPGENEERVAFEKYMEKGGGWIGFHAAAYNDGNTHWPWFNKFLGAGKFFCNTWPPQPALLDVTTSTHAVTRNLPTSFVAPACEWYQWQPSPAENPAVEVLLSLSPKNYPIGIKDVVLWGDFPVVWTNTDYRMIYLNIGHGDEEFIDPTQNLLLVNAIRWIASSSPAGNPFDR